jgi:hypothetical protein
VVELQEVKFSRRSLGHWGYDQKGGCESPGFFLSLYSLAHAINGFSPPYFLRDVCLATAQKQQGQLVTDLN